MSTFQILMIGATLFFAYQIYRHVQTLEDPISKKVVPDVSEPDPISSMKLVEEADLAYEHGKIHEAKLLLEQALNLDTFNPEILNKLAFVSAKTGDHVTAIELYERSLELDENDDLTHNAIASLYRKQGALERAQDHYRKAIEIDDTYPQTFYNYGNLLVDMDDIEEARVMYKRALELKSDFVEAREALLSLGA